MKYSISPWILLMISLNACTGIFYSSKEKVKPLTQDKVISTISAIQKRNNSLMTFKGLGKINLTHNEKSFNARAAWIGSYPNQFRFEIIGIDGHPLISFSFHDNQQFLISHANKTFYHQQNTDGNFEDIISIPIKLNDIIELLTGRIPVCEYSDYEIVEDPSWIGRVLVLKRGWIGVCEKLYLDEKYTKIYKIEIFAFTGGLSYRAIFNGGMGIEDAEVPSKITLTNGNDASVFLRIDRYLKNIPVSSSVFILDPPHGEN